MEEISILYAGDGLESETIRVTARLETRSADDIRYDAENGHWSVTIRERTDRAIDGDWEYISALIPRSRVYQVIDWEIYDEAEHGDDIERDANENEQWHRLRYETHDAIRQIPDNNSELLAPISYDRTTGHWECVIHNPHYVEGGETYVHNVTIPRERVLSASRRSPKASIREDDT